MANVRWQQHSPVSGIAAVLACCAVFLAVPHPSAASANSVFKALSIGASTQSVTSSTLSWEKFSAAEGHIDYAVRSYEPEPHSKESLETDHLHPPSYICRVEIEGILTAGQTVLSEETGGTICIVAAQLSEVERHHAFEVLINKGGGGKLLWRPWDRYHAGIFGGAVSAGTGKFSDYYIARLKPAHHHGGAAGHHYVVGNFDPSVKLVGRIHAPLPGSKSSTEHEHGEILVEIEPVKYELRAIKLNKLRTVIKKNTTVLGSTILSNMDDKTSQAETVITYDFVKEMYWGKHDGVVQGLFTKVYDSRTPQATNVTWGIKNSERRFETKAVNTMLDPGTAINVTLFGNYTEMEAPYSATLKAYYDDNSDPVSRRLSATMVSRDMEDVKIEFSPVYWIQNGTLVPTTTTTTTTTSTTTTTTTTTTSTTEPTTSLRPVPINSTPTEGANGGVIDDDGMSNEIGPLSNELNNRSNEKLEGAAGGSHRSRSSTTGNAATSLRPVASIFRSLFLLLPVIGLLHLTA